MRDSYPRSTFAGITLTAFLLALLLAAGCVDPLASRKLLTYEAVYGPRKVSFSGTYARGLKWLPDGEHYLQREGDVLQRVVAATGVAAPLYDVEALAAALRAQGDFSTGAIVELSRQPTAFSPDYSVALLDHHDQLYLYRFADHALRRLTDIATERAEVTLSPDATTVAYLRAHELYVLDAASGRETQLTTGGNETLLNGRLDWVYQEELFGRGSYRGYWWSADGRQLAYLQLDDANVPTYPLVDYLPTHPAVELLRYPKAGDPNPLPRLGVVSVTGGPTTWVDLSAYAGTEILIVQVAWSPAGRLTFCVQDRESRWLELNEADPATGRVHVLVRDDSRAWLEEHGAPHWLTDGSFLWLSERDGYAHLYHYASDGRLLRRVTEGPWEVRALHGVDTDRNVYFSGTLDSPIEEHAYRVPVAGGHIERLTQRGASHATQFGTGCRWFIDTYSNVTTPPRVRLQAADGSLVRVISANDAPPPVGYQLDQPELLRVPTPRGYALNAMLIRPPGMQPGRKYPVMVFTYAGPHGPSVSNRWSGGHDLVKHLLAQQGYLVWTIDPHSASGEGAASAWQAYQQLGVAELADIEDSLRWLAEHAPVDLHRVGITGHSYGGFMVAYALTHSTMFRIGIAASAVTDWRNYDSVYTDRFMRTPANNPAGYQRSSAVAAARRLHGRLLLVHGAGDDNVHLQNALQLMDALADAGRPFDLMIYPRADHGLYDYDEHWSRLQWDFITAHL